MKFGKVFVDATLSIRLPSASNDLEPDAVTFSILVSTPLKNSSRAGLINAVGKEWAV